MTAAWIGTTTLLLAGGRIYRLLKACGPMALERVMGMILVAMAVRMRLEGVADFLGHVD